MLRHIFHAAALFLLIICFSSAALAQDAWLNVRSKNFNLFGSAPENDIRQAASKLEQFREVFQRLFPKFEFNSPIPTIVIVFKDEQSFRSYKPLDDAGQPTDWVAGFFQTTRDVNYIALSTENIKQSDYQTIFHEYVHFLINNRFGRSNVPLWFNEGLAEFYEQFSIENDRKIKLGNVNDRHLKLLRQYPLIPFDKFFSADYYTLRRQGKDGAGFFYAQAWILMHYLMLGDGAEKNERWEVFADHLLSGKEPEEAFKQVFQIDLAMLEADLKKYIERKSFSLSVVNLKEKLTFDDKMRTSPVSPAEAKALLADLLYRADRLPEAEERAREALKLDENCAQAYLSLGLIKIREKKFNEAKYFLEKGARLDENSYQANFQYAYALSREKMTESGFVNEYSFDEAEKMRELLKRAIALNPNFAESYALYALVCVVRNEKIDEAIEYLKKALLIAPGNQWYLLRSAELLMRKEEFANARRIALKVSQTAPDDDLRLYAQNTAALINSLEAQLESIKRNKKNDRAQNITDEPLSDEEIARLREKAILESINEILRKPKANEKRILGYLSKIECAAGRISYVIKIDNQILNLSSPDFNSVDLTSYSAEMVGAKIGCDTSLNRGFALITYRPNAAEKIKYAGELIAVEFVPAKFRLLN